MKKIFKSVDSAFDPNVQLFKVYQWIMVQDVSTMELVSALSVNASSEKITKLIDQRLAKSKKDKPLAKQVSIDRNMAVPYIPTQFTVGTSFSKHPSYPRLGHRLIYTNTQNPNISFGRVGTVTGVYKHQLEVVFDEPFIGATNLGGRCGYFRGAVVSFLEIFNLSEWKPFVNLKKDIQARIDSGAPRQEWDGKIDGNLLFKQMISFKKDLKEEVFGYDEQDPEAKKDKPATAPKFYRKKRNFH